MDKKLRYLNYVKGEIRKNTFRVVHHKYGPLRRWRVGGIIPLSEELIENLDTTILLGDIYSEVFITKELVSVFLKRMTNRYGIVTEQEFIYVMQGFYEWFRSEKDNIRHGSW